ncbi:MAG: methyltransferase domain-containing protein, partial [Candidatus Gastranaerophilales bacterium]|nr:methyltransferase domain-containing protein [Candidatus Gastranaerophilales bacterium]
LESDFPNADDTDVLEIGAGNGRNALEIAKKGYNMTAAELAKSGQDLMIKQSAEYKLDNLSVTGEDFLKNDNKNKNKFDFIFMSHVSQHFDFKDLNNSLKSINNMLKTNGVAVFDALVRKSSANDLECYEYEKEDGTCHFSKKEIELAAKNNDLKIVDIDDYDESPQSVPWYVNSRLWGRSDLFSRPVELKWLTLKKQNSETLH